MLCPIHCYRPTGKEQFCDIPKKDKGVMDLYKQLPSTKLQVLLVTEISSTLQIKKNALALAPCPEV